MSTRVNPFNGHYSHGSTIVPEPHTIHRYDGYDNRVGRQKQSNLLIWAFEIMAHLYPQGWGDRVPEPLTFPVFIVGHFWARKFTVDCADSYGRMPQMHGEARLEYREYLRHKIGLRTGMPVRPVEIKVLS